MIAFDADVFTELIGGNAAYAALAAQIPTSEQSVPVVVAEDILRGRLNSIRQAEAGKSKLTIDRAYHYFEQSVLVFRRTPILVTVHGPASLGEQIWPSRRTRNRRHNEHVTVATANFPRAARGLSA